MRDLVKCFYARSKTVWENRFSSVNLWSSIFFSLIFSLINCFKPRMCVGNSIPLGEMLYSPLSLISN